MSELALLTSSERRNTADDQDQYTRSMSCTQSVDLFSAYCMKRKQLYRKLVSGRYNENIHEPKTRPMPDFNVVKKCADFDGLLSWAREHAVEDLTSRFSALRWTEGMKRVFRFRKDIISCNSEQGASNAPHDACHTVDLIWRSSTRGDRWTKWAIASGNPGIVRESHARATERRDGLQRGSRKESRSKNKGEETHILPHYSLRWAHVHKKLPGFYRSCPKNGLHNSQPDCLFKLN